jgi:hypothetical protein
VNKKWIGAGAALLMAALAVVATPLARAQAPAADINGAWSAKMNSPMGEMEIVYKLTVKDGKITGTAVLPFGESPIIDGAVVGDQVHFTVQMDMMGNTVKAEAKGKIVGDTLVLTPALPPPPGGDQGGPGGPPPSGGNANSQPGPPPGGDGGGPGGFKIEPLVFHRQA